MQYHFGFWILDFGLKLNEAVILVRERVCDLVYSPCQLLFIREGVFYKVPIGFRNWRH